MTGRGLKKPGWPAVSAIALLAVLCRTWSGVKANGAAMSGQEMACQSASSRVTRSDGGVPAMTVALMAPIEMPHTQSGVEAVLGQRLVGPDVVGAERSAAL